MSALGAQFDGHLVLIGLPGSGKSTIGRAVARELGREVFDFDIEITQRTGRSIPQIFADSGEGYFRKMEIELTEELASRSPAVAAPGGGWITNPGVVALLRPPGRLVHLRISPTSALHRLSRSRVVRPLLLGADPAATMEALWVARKDLYQQADIEVDVEVNDSQRVIDLIVALAHDLTGGLG